MHKDTPLVSVLMSVYDGELYLRKAVESILDQTFRDFEFIVINDSSTDHSAEIVTSYDDRRIRYYENGQNMGLARALNRGLSLARGEHIARMDQDDISLPERLAKQVEFLETHPEVGVLGSAFQIIDEQGTPNHTKRFPAEHGFLRWCLCFGSPIAHPTVMMRTALVREVSGYRTDIRHAEDYDLWWQLSKTTDLCNLQEVLLLYRHNEGSISQVHSTEQRRNGIRISQLIMSETLGENVSLDLVQCIWNRDFETPDQVCQAAQVIHKLWLASDAGDSLSPIERRKIRKDAARRLYLLVRPRLWDVCTWRVLGLACRLDLLLLGRIAQGVFGRLFQARLCGRSSQQTLQHAGGRDGRNRPSSKAG